MHRPLAATQQLLPASRYRVTPTAGLDDAARSKPREYAFLQQLEPAQDGVVNQQAFEKLMVKYASGSSAAGEDMSFEEFAELFKKPVTKMGSSEEIEQPAANAVGYAAFSVGGSLKPWRFTRREVGPYDVRIQITHAGICHSDIHMVNNDWGMSMYPMVPGHEIVGFVTEIGHEVSKFKVGDRAGVGTFVNSCQKCDACVRMNQEQLCLGIVTTYSGKDVDGTITYGGYSTHVVVNEQYVLHVPDAIPLDKAAPLLCAGVTTYSPIRRFGFDKPGLCVGVVGLGGLGHMAVQFLKAYGVTTTVISSSPSKKEDALQVLKADNFIASTDEEAMKAAFGSLDGILDTVCVKHDLSPYMSMLKPDATYVCVGAPPMNDPPYLPEFWLMFRQLRIAGTLTGGIQMTQECLDFCAEKGIRCLTELIPADYINTAYERIAKRDVRYRFVIDVQGSLIA